MLPRDDVVGRLGRFDAAKSQTHTHTATVHGCHVLAFIHTSQRDLVWVGEIVLQYRTGGMSLSNSTDQLNVPSGQVVSGNLRGPGPTLHYHRFAIAICSGNQRHSLELWNRGTISPSIPTPQTAPFGIYVVKYNNIAISFHQSGSRSVDRKEKSVRGKERSDIMASRGAVSRNKQNSKRRTNFSSIDGISVRVVTHGE